MQSFTNPFSIPPTILVSKLVIVSYSPRMLNIDRIRYLVKQSLILNDVRVLPCYITVSLYTIHSMKSPKVIHVVPLLVFSPPFVLPFAPSYLTFLFHHFHPCSYQDVHTYPSQFLMGSFLRLLLILLPCSRTPIS